MSTLIILSSLPAVTAIFGSRQEYDVYISSISNALMARTFDATHNVTCVNASSTPARNFALDTNRLASVLNSETVGRGKVTYFDITVPTSTGGTETTQANLGVNRDAQVTTTASIMKSFIANLFRSMGLHTICDRTLSMQATEGITVLTAESTSLLENVVMNVARSADIQSILTQVAKYVKVLEQSTSLIGTTTLSKQAETSVSKQAGNIQGIDMDPQFTGNIALETTSRVFAQAVAQSVFHIISMIVIKSVTDEVARTIFHVTETSREDVKAERSSQMITNIQKSSALWSRIEYNVDLELKLLISELLKLQETSIQIRERRIALQALTQVLSDEKLTQTIKKELLSRAKSSAPLYESWEAHLQLRGLVKTKTDRKVSMVFNQFCNAVSQVLPEPVRSKVTWEHLETVCTTSMSIMYTRFIHVVKEAGIRVETPLQRRQLLNIFIKAIDSIQVEHDTVVTFEVDMDAIVRDLIEHKFLVQINQEAVSALTEGLTSKLEYIPVPLQLLGEVNKYSLRVENTPVSLQLIGDATTSTATQEYVLPIRIKCKKN